MRYPAVEMMTAICFLLCALTFGPSLTAILGCCFAAILIALTFIDLDYQILPDELTVSLLGLGLLASLLGPFARPEDSILGAVLGFLSLWLIAGLYGKLRQMEVMGRGDFKLFGALGAWLGWQALPITLFLAAVLGILFSLATHAFSDRTLRSPLAFGPALSAAGFTMLLAGTPLTSWLRSLISGI